MSKRARRRHHNRRVKDKARRIARDVYRYLGAWEEKITTFYLKNADNLKVCSRSCCGNPRRHRGGPTHEEKIGAREIADGLAECRRTNEQRR